MRANAIVQNMNTRPIALGLKENGGAVKKGCSVGARKVIEECTDHMATSATRTALTRSRSQVGGFEVAFGAGA
eukprot:CAMPEP_0195645926 /NCGR_PEP_ID=MMETSP0815-20121206/29216_1 /TAXON_ID=97485 /ORGANISM="Prymnesium parvum, Strain Texoma1" /LENGTH=72 /DNA_ID=CAMNT_0040789241 /DNA_START=235 /DNA_END=453 /DNA_ORIENTATION=-